MSIITTERRSRLVVLLTNLAQGQREHEEISRLDAQIRTDYHGRFLIELIQNAVDPAQEAGVTDARLLIVRTPRLLAVLNQGAPFDESGLKALLSLGLSSKQPDEAIGNKGVGFKSVFEVATKAEIFSVDRATANLSGTPALRLAISSAPASEHPGLVAEAASVAEQEALSEKVEERTGRPLPDAIRAALSATTGWRFPLEQPEEDWRRRKRALGLRQADVRPFQTAVVLHLRPDKQPVVGRALGELTDSADEVHLFLPRLGCLEVRERDQRCELIREETVAIGPQGVGVCRLITQRDGVITGTTDYWLISTTLEGPEVAAAARSLPGPGWATVSRAEVQVALPIGPRGLLPKTDGRYFIGLPSKHPTGTPFRVDARFHGTLSRTALDLVDNAYNALLDRTAAELAARLLRHLRDSSRENPTLRSPDRARRMVLYALRARGGSAFGAAVREHLSGDRIVLSRAGTSFFTVEQALGVDDKDRPLIDLLTHRVGDDETTGLTLVDQELDVGCEDLLDDLGVGALNSVRLLARSSEGLSLIERLASMLPSEAVDEWAVLYGWIISLPAGEANDQRVLPVAGGALVRPEDAPFVPLSAEPSREELGSEEVPSMLLEELLFLDRATLEPDGRLRRQLTEGASPPCRRPTPIGLLEGAVLPALIRLVASGSDERAREVLEFGLSLLPRIAPDEDVADLQWLVPCGRQWVSATTAYLGDAWDTDQEEDDTPGLVDRVYGPTGRCVSPWWGQPGHQEAVRGGLILIGVADAPRVLRWTRFEKVLWGDYHQASLNLPQAPSEQLTELWRPWLEHLASTVSVDWGPRTWWHLDGVEWIDGLERPESAADLAAWALTRRHQLVRLTPQPEPNRWGGYRRKDPGAVLQPWAFALQRLNHPFVPSRESCVLKGRLASPKELCIVRAGTRAPAWLPQPANDLNKETLAVIGVHPLEQMPADWLVQQLQTFALSLTGSSSEAVTARGLWRLLGLQMRRPGSRLPVLQSIVLPVWRDGAVVAVSGKDIGRLVLVDEPYAAELLGSSLDGVCRLEQGDHDWTALLEALREALPDADLASASELPLPFEVRSGLPLRSLTGWLRESLGPRVLAIIAALLHRSGVAHKEMRRCWNSLTGAQLQTGALRQPQRFI